MAGCGAPLRMRRISKEGELFDEIHLFDQLQTTLLQSYIHIHHMIGRKPVSLALINIVKYGNLLRLLSTNIIKKITASSQKSKPFMKLSFA